MQPMRRGARARGDETVKIDLDDLARLARAATPGPWKKCSANNDDCPCRTVWSVPLDDAPFCLAETGPGQGTRVEDWCHIAANSPPVTLALVARIRELEEAGRAYLCGGPAKPMLEVIEKGVTIDE